MTKDNSSVTLRDIYEIVERLETRMGSRIEKTETRVDGLESFQSKMVGISLVISSLIGIAGSWFWNKIVKS